MKICFDERALETTYEYPSEQSLLDDMTADNVDQHEHALEWPSRDNCDRHGRALETSNLDNMDRHEHTLEQSMADKMDQHQHTSEELLQDGKTPDNTNQLIYNNSSFTTSTIESGGKVHWLNL